MSDGIVETDSLARLKDRPFEFDFVQAVSLIQQSTMDGQSDGGCVGFDVAPEDEAVRFCVSLSLRNFSGQVVSIEPLDGGKSKYELTIPFIGLVGLNGVLPRFYSQVVISRVKQHDYAMRDFFDLFHHRIISMFFRASVKYRLPYAFRSSQSQTESGDSITQALRCLVGFGGEKLRRQLALPDDNFLFYGGHFADDKPTGHSLERMVEDFTGMPTRVLQFQFEWLYIDPNELTKLSAANNQLGRDSVIGQRVPSIQTRFRVRVGPVRWQDFTELLPDSTQLKKLADLIRVYVGVSLDFDFQVTVRGQEIPKLVLSNDQPPKLGWTTWLFSDPMEDVVEDAVFDIASF